jgi:hypothetical protein
MIAKIFAGQENFELVVFMVDADGPKKKEWTSKRQEIENGFSRIENGSTGIACIPMSASESWLLADQAAWASIGMEEVSPLPSRPETIWGQRNDPSSDHPHCFFARACEAANVEDNRQTRVDIASASNTATLRRKCPVSFVAFADDLIGAP